MGSNQFSVLYNGHPVVITPLEDNIYRVQVTYKPVNIEMVRDTDGGTKWVEVETKLETPLTKEVGRLITDHLSQIE